MGTLTTSKSYNIERPAALTLITAPTSEPVTLAQMKEYLHFAGTDQDDTINECIQGAREELESDLSRAILEQTWDLILDEFPSYCQRTPDAEIILPRPTISSITYLKYYDTDGTLQTWDSANYRLDSSSEPGRLTPAYGVSWPSARTMTGAIQIRFVAASWASAAATPAAIKRWIKAKAADAFNLRGTAVTGTIVSQFTEHIDNAVERYRVRRFT